MSESLAHVSNLSDSILIYLGLVSYTTLSISFVKLITAFSEVRYARDSNYKDLVTMLGSYNLYE